MSSEAHEPSAIYVYMRDMPLQPWQCWGCSVCHELFGIHSDKKPAACPVCGVTFTQMLIGGKFQSVR